MWSRLVSSSNHTAIGLVHVNLAVAYDKRVADTGCIDQGHPPVSMQLDSKPKQSCLECKVGPVSSAQRHERCLLQPMSNRSMSPSQTPLCLVVIVLDLGGVRVTTACRV
jgi:hypothetical protein